MKTSRWAALALVAALPAAASTIVPPQPTAQQAVDLRLTVDSCTFNPATVQVAASGSTLRVTQRLNNCLVPGTPKLYDLRLGNFPAGEYRVEVYASQPASGTPAETLSFTVTDRVEIAITPPPVHPLTNYGGFWWNPGEGGRGLSLTQTPGSDALFGAWYVHGSDNQPTWYSFQGGGWLTPTRWKGKAYRTTGPALTAPFDARLVSTQPAFDVEMEFGELPNANGTMRLTFATGLDVGIATFVRYVP